MSMELLSKLGCFTYLGDVFNPIRGIGSAIYYQVIKFQQDTPPEGCRVFVAIFWSGGLRKQGLNS